MLDRSAHEEIVSEGKVELMTREDQLAALCVGWKASLSNGVPTLTPEAMCADCPELLAEFREQLALDAVDKLFGDTEFTDPPPSYENLKGAGYENVVFVDEGGLGVVLVGEEVQLHRRVAIKQLKPGSLSNPGARERFFAEAEITAHLDHPGVVPIFRSGRDDLGQPYYAMRFIEGEKLGQAIQRLYDDRAASSVASQHIDKFRQLLRCFVSVCQTIGHAHSRGVLHRDLKPDNVMLGAFGAVLVVDWGLAKRFDRPDSEIETAESPVIDESAVGATRQGWAKGSPAFMSPEQAEGDWANVSPASDIYGLGATLYVLLTGQLPYTGDTSTEIVSKVKAGPCTPPEQVNRSVPKALAAICNKAMSRQAGARYPSALDLAEDIQRWLDDKPVNVFRDSVAVRSWRWMRQHRPLVAALAATVLVGVVGLSMGLYFVNAEKFKTELALKESEKQRQAAEKNLMRTVAIVAESVRVIHQPELASYRNHPVYRTLSDAFLSQLDGLSHEKLPQPMPDLLDAERAVLRLDNALIPQNATDSLTLERQFDTTLDTLNSLARKYPDEAWYQVNLGQVYLLQSRQLVLASRVPESKIAAQNAYDSFMPRAAETTTIGKESLRGAVDTVGIFVGMSLLSDEKEDTAGLIDRIDKVLILLKDHVIAAEGQDVAAEQAVE